uniref:Pkinase_Tyr domain-containing protein n=1 Tax=Macrostomum lignano TaxID=282301 RepID=A0A1I8F2C1_9PLAT
MTAAAPTSASGQNTASTSQASTPQLLVPEVSVERIGASRSMVQMFRLLGEGAFGSVHSGQLLVGNKPKDVAVKMLKPKRNWSPVQRDGDYEADESESASQHHQTGCISTRNGPFLLLVELAHHGNLRDFLKYRCLSDRVALQYHNLHPATKQMQYPALCNPASCCCSSRLTLASALDFMAQHQG